MASLLNQGTARMPNSSSSISGVDDKYSVSISVRGDGLSFDIRAPLPERISLAMGATWDTPFSKANMADLLGSKASQMTGGRISSDTISQGAGALGATGRFRHTSMQVWQESTPFEIAIPFVLVAEKDAKTEVMDKVKNLLKLCAPSTRMDNLIPPGPTAIETGTRVTVRVGNFLELDWAVVKNVSCDMNSILHKSGMPMHADVNISVESYYACFTTADLDKLFKV